ncbi:MAG: class I SAM-dependent methyltransferase [Rhodospirillaceae bacterium]|jgi:hypothetical protein|nr:class I SAM-dependent methyltransferase [Rhodospirillaceae bacterium]
MEPTFSEEKDCDPTDVIIGQGEFGGGVFLAAAAITRVLLRLQQFLGINGDIAEIGVLEGAFAIQLVPFLKRHEVFYAIDPYNEYPNLKDTVKNRLVKAAVERDNLKFIHESSKHVSTENLAREKSPGIRFFSIDGDHTEKLVLNDLLLARDTIVDGGIIAVDDYFDRFSPGVSVAMTKYFMEMNQDRLAILISGGNKVFLTTSSEHSMYRTLLEKFTSINQSKSHRDVEWHGRSVLMVENILQDNLPI